MLFVKLSFLKVILIKMGENMNLEEIIQLANLISANTQDFVKYGKNFIVKGTPEYQEWRNRNNRAVNQHRQLKKFEKISAQNQKIIDVIEELLDEYKTLKVLFPNLFESDETVRACDSIISKCIHEFENVKMS